MTAFFRYLIVFLVSLLIAAAFAVYDGYASLSFVTVLDELRTVYLVRYCLVHLFDQIPLIAGTAGIITFSFAVSSFDLGARASLISTIKPVLVTVLVVGVVYGVWIGAVGPRQNVRLEQIRYYSTVARTAWIDAQHARLMGQLEAAQRYAEIYLSVMGENDEVRFFLNDVRSEAASRETSRRLASYGRAGGADHGEEEHRFYEVSELDVASLLKTAKEYYEDGKYFSAHYFASRAVEMSNGRRDARALQAQALNAIEGESFAIKDQPVRDLYQDKLAAYEQLRRGDPEERPEALLGAYFKFQRLLERAPTDPDILRFSEEAEAKVAQISFFVEDARLYSGNHFTGRNDIFFRNRNSPGLTEYIFADRMVQSPEGDFFFDVEVYQVSEEGVLHFQSDFARRINENLFFRAVEREPLTTSDEGRIHRPRLIEGDPQTEIPGYIPLIPSIDQIVLLAGRHDRFESVPLTGLAGLSRLYDRFGRFQPAATMAFAQRLLQLVGFFIVAFGSIAIGWRYRSFYLGRPPFISLLAVPLFPAVLWWFRGLPSFLLSLVIYGLSPLLSAGAVIGVTLMGLFLLLFLTVMFLARRRVGP